MGKVLWIGCVLRETYRTRGGRAFWRTEIAGPNQHSATRSAHEAAQQQSRNSPENKKHACEAGLGEGGASQIDGYIGDEATRKIRFRRMWGQSNRRVYRR